MRLRKPNYESSLVSNVIKLKETILKAISNYFKWVLCKLKTKTSGKGNWKWLVKIIVLLISITNKCQFDVKRGILSMQIVPTLSY